MPRRHRYQPRPFPVQVAHDSPASRAGIRSGDILLAVNGEPVGDFLVFYHQIAEESLELELERQGGKRFSASIQRSYGVQLGLIPNPAPLQDIVECENKCVFCFIHQQPKGLRRTVFIRDDDYRYSFSHGNFITLTNLYPADWRRIYRERLSPLYISVHSMRPSVRDRMLKHPRSRRIRQQLTSLARHGIDFHTQIVLCPGFNDAAELDHTLTELLPFRPHLLSVSIVPVGLTDYRTHLPDLRPLTLEQAKATIARVEKWQQICQKRFKDPIVRLGDEFYWMCGVEFPPYAHYGDFSQLEDGVGNARMFIETFRRQLSQLPASLPYPRRVTILTGRMAADVLTPLAQEANDRVRNLTLDVIPCRSYFWGERITAAGLLMGQDLLRNASGRDLGDEVWIPELMVRNPEQRFLDDMTLAEFRIRLGKPVRAVPEKGEKLAEAIRSLQDV